MNIIKYTEALHFKLRNLKESEHSECMLLNTHDSIKWKN
jgi:hypothetical protein